MLTTNDLFERELKKLLKAEIERLSEILTGPGVSDFSQYKYYVGAIHGLSHALEQCEEANSIVEQTR